jgi:hypothetical protein
MQSLGLDAVRLTETYAAKQQNLLSGPGASCLLTLPAHCRRQSP